MLNPLQARFCEEYVLDLNATAAYIRAGYRARDHAAEVAASKLLARPAVAARVAELKAARSKRTEFKADDVVRRLWREAHRVGKGSSHGARVKALEVLARHHGLLTDRLKVEGGPTVNVRPLEKLTDEQLNALLAGLPAAGAAVDSI